MHAYALFVCPSVSTSSLATQRNDKIIYTLSVFETRITGYFLHLLREWRYFKINEYCRVYSRLIAVMNSLNYHLLHVTLLYLPAFLWYDCGDKQILLVKYFTWAAKTLCICKSAYTLWLYILTSILNIHIYYSVLFSVAEYNKMLSDMYPLQGSHKVMFIFSTRGQ